MKFEILIPLLIYYLTMSVLFIFGIGILTGYDTTDVTTFVGTNTYTTAPVSLDFFDYVVGLIGFIGIGIGLPSDTPLFIQILFTAWTIGINIVAVALIYQALRAS